MVIAMLVLCDWVLQNSSLELPTYNQVPGWAGLRDAKVRSDSALCHQSWFLSWLLLVSLHETGSSAPSGVWSDSDKISFHPHYTTRKSFRPSLHASISSLLSQDLLGYSLFN